MDLKGCRNVFLLVTLGAAALSDPPEGNPFIIPQRRNGVLHALTCNFTYSDTQVNERASIQMQWFHGDVSRLRSENFVVNDAAEKVSLTLSLPGHAQGTKQDIDAIYSCIVAVAHYECHCQSGNNWPRGPCRCTSSLDFSTSFTDIHVATWSVSGKGTAISIKTTPTTSAASTRSSEIPKNPTPPVSSTSSSKISKNPTPPVSSTSSSKISNMANTGSGSTLQAVTLPLIFILVAAVIVLAVFLIRIRRNAQDKTVGGGTHSGESARPQDDFDEYAHLGGSSRSDDIYRSLGKGRRIPGQMNAAFEPEGAEYIDVLEKGGQPMASDPQGRLEDGLRDGTTDTLPIYIVLDPDAVAENDDEEAANPSLYAMEGTGIPTSSLGAAGKGRPPQDEYSLAGAFTKKPGTDADDYSRPYGRPPPQKATPGTKIAAKYLPMTGLQIKPTTMLKAGPRDSLDASDDYAEPDGSFPSGPKAFLNSSKAGHDQPATEEDDDYNRLNLPKATKKRPAKPAPRVSNPDKTAEDDYSQPYGRAKMAAKGWQGSDGDDYNRLELPHLANPKSMVGLQKVAMTPKTPHSADGIPEDDKDDYEAACDVIQ